MNVSFSLELFIPSVHGRVPDPVHSLVVSLTAFSPVAQRGCRTEQTPIPVIRKMLQITYRLHKRTEALVRSRSMRKTNYEKSEFAIKHARSVQIIPVCFSRISSYRFIDLISVA